MPLPKWEIALQHLSPAQREQIHARLRTVAFAARKPMFRQGEPSDSLVVVRKGRVRLYAGTESGEEFTLGVMDSGRILGLAAAILGRPRLLSAESIDAVEADILPLSDLRHCMDAIPQFAQNVMQLLATLAAETLAGIVPVALDSAVVRLGTILLALGAAADDEPHGTGLRVSGLTHEDLAKMVGASRTWVSVTLGAMERQQLIAKKKGSIAILDRERLASHIDAQRNRYPSARAPAVEAGYLPLPSTPD